MIGFAAAAVAQDSPSNEAAPLVHAEQLAEPPATEDPAVDLPLTDASPVAALEQLLQSPVETPVLQQEVTTVTGGKSTVGRSAAAVFVITPEMIRDSGATSIPEVLRLAPGLQVARVDTNEWSITSRGFNSNIAGILAANNKLLVLIDGRTVYTPFFSGTYWDVQDLLLNDIERIEVIRGPGATIWGANAVNGVVNIITKRAKDTQGVFAQAGGGNVERGFVNARVGGQSGENLHYRVYGKGFDRSASVNPALPEADDWQQGRGGFRADWTPNDCDLFTVQGDAYSGENSFFNQTGAPPFMDDERVQGGNVLARWTRTLSDESNFQLQLYYDRADRYNHLGFVDQEFNTYDIDFRHNFASGNHKMVWGVGFRSVHDDIQSLTAPPTPMFWFDPERRAYDTLSMFAQDEIALSESHFLTVGAKLQHNDFTDWEVQPTIRLLYSPEETWALWTAVSRAVRTPSRIEHDGRLGTAGIPFFQFSDRFKSEELIAYELGYRAQPAEWFSWDAALFYNQYEHLSAITTTPVTVLPLLNNNSNRGEGYGFELSSQIEVTPNWHLLANYSFLQLQIHPGPGTVNFLGSTGELIEGSSPHNQILLMSAHQLPRSVEVDFIGRYVDELPVQQVPAYITMDIRLAWRPYARTEISVVGQNLLDARHLEYIGGNEIKRGVYGMLTYEW